MVFKKRNRPWNKGIPSKFKGIPRSVEVRKKISGSKKGKKRPPFSKEWRQHMSEGQKAAPNAGRFKKGRTGYWTGRKRPVETVEKMRVSFRGRVPWNKGKVCPDISERMKGRHATAEARRKQSEAKRGEKHWNFGKHLSAQTREKIRLARLKQILPNKDTLIERLIQKELEHRNVSCYRNKAVENICQPDFAFPNVKVAVFADGDYWHNRAHTKETDARVNAVLQERGWRVLRFWEHEIKAGPVRVVDEILKEVRARSRELPA